MTGKPLFVYGTLRDADVLHALLGHVLPAHRCIDANAPGFAAVHYPQRVYPALIAASLGNAPGRVLSGLTAIELDILDAFEGDEYCRDTIAVLTASGTVEADVYRPVIAIPADAEPWTLERWTVLHKPAVLDGERRTAAALRDRLSVAGTSTP